MILCAICLESCSSSGNPIMSANACDDTNYPCECDPQVHRECMLRWRTSRARGVKRCIICNSQHDEYRILPSQTVQCLRDCFAVSVGCITAVAIIAIERIYGFSDGGQQHPPSLRRPESYLSRMGP